MVVVISENFARHRWPSADRVGKRTSRTRTTNWSDRHRSRRRRDARRRSAARAGRRIYLPVRQSGSPNFVVRGPRAGSTAYAPRSAGGARRRSAGMPITQLRPGDVVDENPSPPGRVHLDAAGAVRLVCARRRRRRHRRGHHLHRPRSGRVRSASAWRSAHPGNRSSATWWRRACGLVWAGSPSELRVPWRSPGSSRPSFMASARPTFSRSGAVSILFVGVAAAASAIPAWRVAEIDPVIALRHE